MGGSFLGCMLENSIFLNKMRHSGPFHSFIYLFRIGGKSRRKSRRQRRSPPEQPSLAPGIPQSNATGTRGTSRKEEITDKTGKHPEIRSWTAAARSQ